MFNQGRSKTQVKGQVIDQLKRQQNKYNKYNISTKFATGCQVATGKDDLVRGAEKQKGISKKIL